MSTTMERTEAKPKLVTEFRVRPEAKDAFIDWQSGYLEDLEKAEGFSSRETISPSPSEPDTWVFITQFQVAEALLAWRNAPARKVRVNEVRPLLQEDGFAELSGRTVDEIHREPSVTEVILDRVLPGQREAYQDWSRRMQKAQATFAGYQGGYTQPASDNGGAWMTIMRFATVDDLDRWMRSPERLELVTEGRTLVTDSYLHQVDTSFPGWIPSDPATGESPPNWKTSLLVLLGLYPIVALEILYLKIPFVAPALAGFIGNFLSVAATGFITMPLFVRWMGWWLFPPKESAKAATLKGTALLIVIFAVEIAVFWKAL